MQAKDIGTYLGIALGVISLGGLFIRLGTIQSDINNKIVVLESKIERFEEGNTSQNTEIVKDIEKIFEDLDGLDVTKETVQVVAEVRRDLDKLLEEWDGWRARVVPLDVEQTSQIKANEVEIQRIKDLLR